jgi:hypothetical protein
MLLVMSAATAQTKWTGEEEPRLGRRERPARVAAVQV